MLSAMRDEPVHASGAVEPFTLFAGNDHGVFRAAIETAPAATVVCDVTSTILFSNRRTEAMFGYPPGALIGCSVERLIPEGWTPATDLEPSSFGHSDRQLTGGRPVLGRHRDGTDLHVVMALTPITRTGRRLVIVSLIEPGERDQSDRPVPVSAVALGIEAPRVALIEDRGSLRRPANPLPAGQVVAESPAEQRALKQIAHVAPTNATVLLTGETGSGKEVFAQAIHNMNARHRRSMVRVNCGAIPEGLLESELFGHERGAFTGALNQHIGRFEQANGSTIFLDEIGESPLDGQVKLLRVLQSKEVERLGGGRPVKVDVRIIAATNRDLERAVETREFRADLYYRLNIFPVHVPPLRDRVEDIPQLVWSFVDEIAGAVESEHIRVVLDRTNWRIRGTAGAADLLRLKPTTLESRMTRLGIRRSA
jgi:PAS domain S-box-containing protein